MLLLVLGASIGTNTSPAWVSGPLGRPAINAFLCLGWFRLCGLDHRLDVLTWFGSPKIPRTGKS